MNEDISAPAAAGAARQLSRRCFLGAAGALGLAAMGTAAPGSAPGSAFNPNGTSGGVYAGNGSGSAHSNSGNSVSQYDVACYQTSNNGP